MARILGGCGPHSLSGSGGGYAPRPTPRPRRHQPHQRQRLPRAAARPSGVRARTTLVMDDTCGAVVEGTPAPACTAIRWGWEVGGLLTAAPASAAGGNPSPPPPQESSGRAVVQAARMTKTAPSAPFPPFSSIVGHPDRVAIQLTSLLVLPLPKRFPPQDGPPLPTPPHTLSPPSHLPPPPLSGAEEEGEGMEGPPRVHIKMGGGADPRKGHPSTHCAASGERLCCRAHSVGGGRVPPHRRAAVRSAANGSGAKRTSGPARGKGGESVKDDDAGEVVADWVRRTQQDVAPRSPEWDGPQSPRERAKLGVPSEGEPPPLPPP